MIVKYGRIKTIFTGASGGSFLTMVQDEMRVYVKRPSVATFLPEPDTFYPCVRSATFERKSLIVARQPCMNVVAGAGGMPRCVEVRS